MDLQPKVNKNFLFTIDAYQIDIRNKIVLSEALTVSGITALTTELQGTGIQQISFFTNHVNTQTRGIDVVTNYKADFGTSQALNASLAFTLNKTKITEIKSTPPELQAGTVKPIAIIDTINIALIETAQPRQKVILSLDYSVGKFDFIARGTYFGKVTAWEKPTNLPHQSQTFSGKTLIDASVGFNFTKNVLLTVGSDNITDAYPDKVITTYSAYGTGQTPYNRNVNQFGFNGAFYYISLTVKF